MSSTNLNPNTCDEDHERLFQACASHRQAGSFTFQPSKLPGQKKPAPLRLVDHPAEDFTTEQLSTLNRQIFINDLLTEPRTDAWPKRKDFRSFDTTKFAPLTSYFEKKKLVKKLAETALHSMQGLPESKAAISQVQAAADAFDTYQFMSEDDRTITKDEITATLAPFSEITNQYRDTFLQPVIAEEDRKEIQSLLDEYKSIKLELKGGQHTDKLQGRWVLTPNKEEESTREGVEFPRVQDGRADLDIETATKAELRDMCLRDDVGSRVSVDGIRLQNKETDSLSPEMLKYVASSCQLNNHRRFPIEDRLLSKGDLDFAGFDIADGDVGTYLQRRANVDHTAKTVRKVLERYASRNSSDVNAAATIARLTELGIVFRDSVKDFNHLHLTNDNLDRKSTDEKRKRAVEYYDSMTAPFVSSEDYPELAQHILAYRRNMYDPLELEKPGAEVLAKVEKWDKSTKQHCIYEVKALSKGTNYRVGTATESGQDMTEYDQHMSNCQFHPAASKLRLHDSTTQEDISLSELKQATAREKWRPKRDIESLSQAITTYGQQSQWPLVSLDKRNRCKSLVCKSADTAANLLSMAIKVEARKLERLTEQYPDLSKRPDAAQTIEESRQRVLTLADPRISAVFKEPEERYEKLSSMSAADMQAEAESAEYDVAPFKHNSKGDVDKLGLSVQEFQKHMFGQDECPSGWIDTSEEQATSALDRFLQAKSVGNTADRYWYVAK